MNQNYYIGNTIDIDVNSFFKKKGKLAYSTQSNMVFFFLKLTTSYINVVGAGSDKDYSKFREWALVRTL